MIFLKLVRAEFAKTKGTFIRTFFFMLIVGSIGAFFVPFYFKSYEDFLRSNLMEEKPNPWWVYYFDNYLFVWTFVLPIVVSAATYVIKNIEDRSDAWKRLFVLPYNRATLHMAKLSVIWTYTTLYITITFLILILSGMLLSKLKPDFDFNAHPTYHEFLIIFCAKFILASMAICSFSYAYMIFIRKTVVSLLLGIFLPIVCLFFTNQYSSPLYQVYNFHGERVKMLINSRSYETLHVNVIGTHDIVCIVVFVVSLASIFVASRRPIINYE